MGGQYMTSTCLSCGGPCDSRAQSGRCARCRPRRDVVDRVADRISISAAGCWEFNGARTPSGYGQVNIGDGVRRLTHRVMYERFVGPVPDGLELDHLCRNRICCNPDHLEAVPHGVNVRRGNASKLRTRKTCVVCGATMYRRYTKRTCGGDCANKLRSISLRARAKRDLS